MENTVHRPGQRAEREWHEELYRQREPAKLVVPPEIKQRYLQVGGHPLFHLELMFRLVGDVRGKKILCLGCGDENSTVLLVWKGAEVWASDLSFEAIQLQRQIAAANGVEARLHTLVCAAEELPFPTGYFDIVFGSAILHHLPDSLPALPHELARILKEGAFVLFSEPVVRSHFIRWLRSRFPAYDPLSPGERQLTDDDFRPFTQYFDLEFFPFHLLSRLGRFVAQEPLEYTPSSRRALVYVLHGLDYLLLRAPWFDRFAGIVVMKGSRKHALPTRS